MQRGVNSVQCFSARARSVCPVEQIIFKIRNEARYLHVGYRCAPVFFLPYQSRVSHLVSKSTPEVLANDHRRFVLPLTHDKA